MEKERGGRPENRRAGGQEDRRARGPQGRELEILSSARSPVRSIVSLSSSGWKRGSMLKAGSQDEDRRVRPMTHHHRPHCPLIVPPSSWSLTATEDRLTTTNLPTDLLTCPSGHAGNESSQRQTQCDNVTQPHEYVLYSVKPGRFSWITIIPSSIGSSTETNKIQSCLVEVIRPPSAGSRQPLALVVCRLPFAVAVAKLR